MRELFIEVFGVELHHNIVLLGCGVGDLLERDLEQVFGLVLDVAESVIQADFSPVDSLHTLVGHYADLNLLMILVSANYIYRLIMRCCDCFKNKKNDDEPNAFELERNILSHYYIDHFSLTVKFSSFKDTR